MRISPKKVAVNKEKQQQALIVYVCGDQSELYILKYHQRR